MESIGELVREKKIDGIAELRDESDRTGIASRSISSGTRMRDVVLNQIYRFTPLQSSFGANVVALDGGRPLVMSLKDLLLVFISFREEVVSRRTKYLLNKARERAHVLVGSGHRCCQYRRNHSHHPRRTRSGRGARSPDGAQLAGSRLEIPRWVLDYLAECAAAVMDIRAGVEDGEPAGKEPERAGRAIGFANNGPGRGGWFKQATMLSGTALSTQRSWKCSSLTDTCPGP